MAIDTNGDWKIDLHEALDSMHMEEENGTTPEWFTDLDSNHDGSLDTTEFDSDLNDDVLAETGWSGERCHICVPSPFGSSCQPIPQISCDCHALGTSYCNYDGKCFCKEGWFGSRCHEKLFHPSIFSLSTNSSKNDAHLPSCRMQLS